MKTYLGKIIYCYYGLGGYQDVQLGISFSFEFDSSGITDFWGFWADPPSEYAKWDLADQIECHGETANRIAAILKEAKVRDVSKLVGIPVEITIDKNQLSSWRILTEVL